MGLEDWVKDWDEALEYLVKKHPEVQAVKFVKGLGTTTSKGLQAILTAENIRIVELVNCRFTDTGLNSQANYSKHIQSLTLGDLSDQGLIQILQICGNGLKTLGVPHSNITGEGFSALQDFNKLKTLSLKGCSNLTHQRIIEFLQICGFGLKTLDLSYTNVNGEGLSVLRGKLTNLETLDFSVCSRLTDQGLQNWLQICGSELKTLVLYGTSITGEGIAVLKGKLANLETLDLSWCSSLTDQGLREWLQICGSGLKTLDLECTYVTGEGLSVLRGTELKTLNLSCTNATGKGLSVLRGKLNLENLCLGYCSFTDQGLQECCQICETGLKTLDLSGTVITADGVSVLQLTNLKTLYLRERDDTVQELTKFAKKLCGPGRKSLYLTGASAEVCSHIRFLFPAIRIIND